jgi:hypothetical protein
VLCIFILTENRNNTLPEKKNTMAQVVIGNIENELLQKKFQAQKHLFHPYGVDLTFVDWVMKISSLRDLINPRWIIAKPITSLPRCYYPS